MQMTNQKDLYRRYISALVIKDGEALDQALDQVLAADFIAHDLPGGQVDGRSARKAFRRQVHIGFPDQTLTIELQPIIKRCRHTPSIAHQRTSGGKRKFRASGP